MEPLRFLRFAQNDIGDGLFWIPVFTGMTTSGFDSAQPPVGQASCLSLMTPNPVIPNLIGNPVLSMSKASI
ncbi:MAG: hypothetical protein K8S87_04650 [Planctomycetes bacterium]|nr:hypothetical protein [Planctomycetota bacterium]